MYTKLFSKPPMSEKLLSRPPFKYLFDVVLALIKSTQFADGLYTEAELDPNIYSSKEPKLRFLQKIIDCVQLVNGVQLDVRPGKVVAGQEPEKTNEWLQAMCQAAISKKDYKAAVKQVLAAEGTAAAHPAPEAKNEGKEEHKEKVVAKPKEAPKEAPKEPPKEAPKEHKKDPAKETAKAQPKPAAAETKEPAVAAKAQPKAPAPEAKEQPAAKPKAEPKEAAKAPHKAAAEPKEGGAKHKEAKEQPAHKPEEEAPKKAKDDAKKKHKQDDEHPDGEANRPKTPTSIICTRTSSNRRSKTCS